MGAASSVLLCIALAAAGTTAFIFASVLVGLVAHKQDRRALILGVRNVINAMVRRFGHMPLVVAARARKKAKSQEQELREGMPEAIRLIGISLESGSSVATALQYAAANTQGAVSAELQRVLWDIRAGQGFDEAMGNLRARSTSSEFAYLAAAMEIQHASGGSIGNVLSSVAEALRQNSELRQQLETQTAQARLSAKVVSLMPVALLCVLTLVSPSYTAMFFQSPFGVVLFCFGVCLEIAGIVLVKRCSAAGISPMAGGAL